MQAPVNHGSLDQMHDCLIQLAMLFISNQTNKIKHLKKGMLLT